MRIELLSSCYPSWHILCPSNYEWRVVYKTWCQWQHIGKWSFITRIFEDTSLTKVTCMKISGRCIITGHNSGDVLLWACGNHVKVASHLRPVTSLGVMVYSGEYKFPVVYYAFFFQLDTHKERCIYMHVSVQELLVFRLNLVLGDQ